MFADPVILILHAVYGALQCFILYVATDHSIIITAALVHVVENTVQVNA